MPKKRICTISGPDIGTIKLKPGAEIIIIQRYEGETAQCKYTFQIQDFGLPVSVEYTDHRGTTGPAQIGTANVNRSTLDLIVF